MQYTSLIFDLDGTLLDSLYDIADAAQHILVQYNYPTYDYATYRHFIGNGLAKLIERAAPSESSSEQLGLMLEELRDYYANHWAVKTKPYEGIVETLDSLKEKGCQLFVLSNKDHAFTVDMVEHFFGTTLFTEIHGLKPEMPAKPDPQSTLSLCLRNGITPNQALFIGDLTVDLETASNAGITAVGVNWGFRPEEIQSAPFIINSPAELLQLVDEGSQG